MLSDPSTLRLRQSRHLRRPPRAPKAKSTRFVVRALREAPGPLTLRQSADMQCADRGLTAKALTASMLRKRLGATLKALHHDGLRTHVEGLIGWRLA